MKKLKLVLAVSISILLFSCSNDDDTQNSPLIGTWNLEALDLIIDTTITRADGTVGTINTVGVGRDLEFTNTFTENPNELLKQGAILIDLTTTTDGFETHSTIASTGNNTYNWHMNGDDLEVIDYKDQANIYTINSLEQNTLIYSINETRETEENGLIEIVVIKETYHFYR